MENDFFLNYRKKAMERLPRPEHSKEDQIPGSKREILLKAWESGKSPNPGEYPRPCQPSRSRLGQDQDAQEVTGRDSHLSMLLKVY